jgi:hypothetical protein
MKDLSKYLCPWTKHDESSYEKHLLTSPLVFYRVWKLDKDNLWRYGNSNGYENLYDAMTKIDKILIKTGFTLLTQEQYEKLKVLL